ncbi:MAG: AmmeMemoRadiSam system protein B [Candidatus Micrarchaeia archaeon]
MRSSNMSLRRSVVAGEFYSSSASELSAFISKAIAEAKVPEGVEKACAYVSPHAGYEYSGRTAAYAYKALSMNAHIKDIDSIVLVGPNHTGIGTQISVSETDWETPLGTVRNDLELSKAIVDASGIAEFDESAHAGEHSLEVQLPFLQYLNIGKKAAFICMGYQDLDTSKDLALAIADAVKTLGRHAIVIASSDFNHYESRSIGEKKDKVLFKYIESLDYAEFNKSVDKVGSSACGYGPITVAMEYASMNGCKKGILLYYSNSGLVTGDFNSVVDYASFAMV